jgi:hypothetical protein
MTGKVSFAKEIVISVSNKIGVLADVAGIIADHGINVAAIAGYGKSEKKEAEVLLVTSDNARAVDVLKKSGYGVPGERDVLILELENKPGVLKTVTAVLAGIGADIKHIYGSACPGGCPSTIVLNTSDNEKALASFKNL